MKMDWKYLNSVTIDELKDTERDELFNTITWYNCETDTDLTLEKCVTVVKLSQDILKYKGEQVETLLAELDEIAIKEAEQESKKSEDVKSVRSKRSQSSLEIDDLEDKVKDLRHKLKQQSKLNEKQKVEMEKFQRKISSLENENKDLQNELKVLDKDETQSDISETIKDQHKDLIDSIHEKNKQISQLLDDIEITERENVVLKEKLTTLRDELVEATKQLNTESNLTSNLKSQIESQTEKIGKQLAEIEGLRGQVQELEEEKNLHNVEVERFKNDIELKINEWRNLLATKNEEIQRLKEHSKLTSSNSTSTISEEYDKSEINVLTKVINEREEKILELQEQLQIATKDIEENTKVIENLMQIKTSNDSKIKELSLLVKDLKKQLKASHNRSQEIQNNLQYAEKLIKENEDNFNHLTRMLEDDGQIDTSDVLKSNRSLKTENVQREKQVEDLVKTTNKLQHILDAYERENIALKDKLGLPEDSSITGIHAVLTKQQKQKKMLKQLFRHNSELEEEKIALKIKNKELSNVISNLFEQVDETTPKDSNIQEYITNEMDEMDGSHYKEMTEENAALRKGLQEILDMLHATEVTGGQKIKTDTLEKLLRALDARHVSGWYHPAMRLQAELHTLEGTNSELREQLRLTRLELSKYMESPRSGEFPLIRISETDLNNSEIIANLNSHLLTVLNNYKLEETTNKALMEKVEEYRQEFAIIHQQIVMLYKQYADEKKKFNKQDEELNTIQRELSAKVEDLQKELDIYYDFSKLSNDEVTKREKLKEMAIKIVTLNRKCIYFEYMDKELSTEINTLKENLLNSETTYISKINKLDIEKQELLNKITKSENVLINTSEKQHLVKIQDELDKLTLKHRDLLKNIAEIQENHRKEFEILRESNTNYKKEKEELNSKLLETLNKLHIFEETSCNVDNAIQSLTKKLAQSEVNEITERQRGNHINNLYELVKEQLKNSEDRYTEFEKFNKEVMRKNLQLQENIKDLQDKIINYVDLTEFHTLKTQHDKLLDDKKTLMCDQLNLREQLELIKKKDESITLWNSMKEFEFLNLKHQIVDLQSNSDEKAIIARLSADVVNARLAEAECRKIIENLRMEIDKAESDIKQREDLLNEERLKNEKLYISQNLRISELQHIIKQQRLNYYGSVPLISENHFVANLNKTFADKHEAFLSLRRAQENENESSTLKDQLVKHIGILDELKNESNANNKILQWYQEKKSLQLQELRHKRHAEFKENQLRQALHRITLQDEQITKLEEELLLAYQKPELFLENIEEIKEEDAKETINIDEHKKECKLKMFQSEEVQTSIDLFELKDSDPLQADVLNKLQNDLSLIRSELETKEKIVEEYKSKITELELNVNLFKTQLGDKQSQIMFYEKHILELKNKLEATAVGEKIEETTEKGTEEIALFKVKISELQLMISQKEENIVNLQSLLKKDRDEHSLAAARTQNELKKLYNLLNVHQQKSVDKENLDDSKEYQSNLTAIEQYVRQVHALEHHTTELHSNISTLNNQLLTSQEEIVRWKTLANERLQNIDTVRLELQDKFMRENAMYRNECEKWRNEIRKLNQIISSYRESANEVKVDITQLLKDKDDQIHKLTTTLRQLQKELRNQPDVDALKSDFEDEKQQFINEYETLKRRFEQLITREKKAREEIRNLRSQLVKRPVLSARSDRSDSSREHQLIKKTSSLEREVEDLKEKLDKQVTINEAHRIKVDEDFDKWNKQKQWQQAAEKLKNKLKERNDEYNKLQHTCSGYRILIERLEREKYALENRIKILKNRNNNPHNNQVEALEMENAKLSSHIDMLTSKLDIQHHHSGSLAATMLQEKLEAQERKIAILELSAKCPLDVRTEIERLHNTLSNLQKKNLQLEAQNLEISLDLQKCHADTPHLREQIQYLESYIEVLKTENTNKHEVDHSGDHIQQNVETKKIPELERTVFILKRLVEKLQAENKRLNSGTRLCTQTTTSCSSDVLRKDYQHLKEQYGECVQKNARLEQELNSTKKTLRSLQNKPITRETLQTLSEQLNEAKVQLAQKSELLDKVKILLHRAASKEKALTEEITALRQNLNDSENQSVHSA